VNLNTTVVVDSDGPRESWSGSVGPGDDV